MSDEELEILQALDAALQPQQVRALIDPKATLARQKLVRDSTALLAWEAVPLGWFGDAVPGLIHSAWVFILRAGAATGAERHPNSHQRMMSYRGSGDLQIRKDEQWRSNPLVSDSGTVLERRWVSIPTNVWHQAVVPPEDDWVVVSFHTAGENDLIEERPDPADCKLTRRRTYSSCL